jgi:hypothetical protein
MAGALATALVLLVPATAAASPFDPSGVLTRVSTPLALHFNASQSNNWFGYSQGALEQGLKLFNSITGDWTVPTATQHTAGQAADSATWIGIGGGCINAGCSTTDPTSLIQTGTEQGVDATGKASYSAWWELIPVPSLTISTMSVSPGDRMHAQISEVVPNLELWTITLRDVTKNETFTTTVPYPSSHLSAEWIEETPVSVGTGGAGITALPKLSETPFDNATVNGKPAALKSSEAIDLTSGSSVIGSVSAPDPEADGFGACAWTTVCGVPSS